MLKKEEKQKVGRKDTVYPTKHRFPKKSMERQEGLLQ